MDDQIPLEAWPLEKLWQLFPIILSEYNPEWPVWYAEFKQHLAKQYKHHRDNYTDAKTNFIAQHSS